jgi:hypothetical protein
VTHREVCGDVAAVWRGRRVEGQEQYAELEFSLPGRAAPMKFPHGEMYPPYWSFKIFAPDCKHVLLLTSYTGPYHVVRASRLAEYLAGAPPDHVLAGRAGERGNVSDGAWSSASEVRYSWGCCDPPVELRFQVPPGR